MRKWPILQLDLKTGEVIKEYAHMALANIAMGVCPRQNEIKGVCKREKKSDFGFGWKFKDDYERESKE